MSTVTAENTAITEWHNDSHIVSWTPITTANEVGSSEPLPGSHIKSVQFTGTFGAAATITLEGSNDGSNWVVLTDPQGNSISKTAAAIEAIEEHTRYVRPKLASGGDGSTSITVTLFVKRIK